MGARSYDSSNYTALPQGNGLTNLTNTPIFQYIIGYDDKEAFEGLIRKYAKQCAKNCVYILDAIPIPNAVEAEKILKFITTGDTLNITQATITALVTPHIPVNVQSVIINNLLLIYDNLKSELSLTQLKNMFVRVIYSLLYQFVDAIKQKSSQGVSNILYIGKVNKYDILTFTTLKDLGVSVLLIDLGSTVPTGFITAEYVLQSGKLTQIVDVDALLLSESPVVRNSWVTVGSLLRRDNTDVTNVIAVTNVKQMVIDECKRVLQQVQGVRTIGTYGVLTLTFCGYTDAQHYDRLLNSLYLTLKESKNVVIIDSTFTTPTPDEVAKYAKSVDIAALLTSIPALNVHELPKRVQTVFNTISKLKNAENESIRNNTATVVKATVGKLCDLLFTERTLSDSVPTVIIVGELKGKTHMAVECLSELPVDILHFSPLGVPQLKLMNSIDITLGDNSCEIVTLPKVLNQMTRVNTTAYTAQQEIRKVLASEDVGIYQGVQFRDSNSVILNTTYDEVNMLWHEPARFRESFSSVGDIVTIPTIFAKIDGIAGNKKEYLAAVKKKLGAGTFCVEYTPTNIFPFMPESVYEDRSNFIRTLLFNDIVDYEKFEKSKYFQNYYGILNTTTRAFFSAKLSAFLKSDWCRVEWKNDIKFKYKVLNALLTLPEKIIHMIHTFSFTEQLPKLVLFGSGGVPCSTNDCIVIMFLKYIGFDVLVYTPSGYDIFKGNIQASWFNILRIGEFDFSLTDLSLANLAEAKKKPGFMQSIKNLWV